MKSIRPRQDDTLNYDERTYSTSRYYTWKTSQFPLWLYWDSLSLNTTYYVESMHTVCPLQYKLHLRWCGNRTQNTAKIKPRSTKWYPQHLSPYSSPPSTHSLSNRRLRMIICTISDCSHVESSICPFHGPSWSSRLLFHTLFWFLQGSSKTNGGEVLDAAESEIFQLLERAWSMNDNVEPSDYASVVDNRSNFMGPSPDFNINAKEGWDINLITPCHPQWLVWP